MPNVSVPFDELYDQTPLPAMSAAAQEAGALLAAARPAARFTTYPQFQQVLARLQDPVTALLKERLGAILPGLPWAQEDKPELPEHGETWVVDPVDGVVQLIQGMPYYCVSIALVRDRRPVAAVLHAPALGETYAAAAGHGATRDGVPVTPSVKQLLRLSMLATSAPPDVADQPSAADLAGRSLGAVLPVAGAVRNLGPTSWQIADVASGRLDGFWQYGRDAANLLPAALVAREAGVRVTDAAGDPWEPGSASFVAAAPQLHDALLPYLPVT